VCIAISGGLYRGGGGGTKEGGKKDLPSLAHGGVTIFIG